MTDEADRERAAVLLGASAPDALPGTAGRGDRGQFWRRSLRTWDVAFYAMVTVGAFTLAVDLGPGTDLAIVLGLLAGLLLAYTLLGRRIARHGARRLVAPYLTVLVVLSAAVTLVSTTGTILLFLAYSQIWYFSLSRRGGVIASTALTVAVFGAVALAPALDRSDLPSIMAQATLALSFSVLLGLWITQVAEQSEQRAELLDQLEATQTELAASHHAAGVTAERERVAQEIHDTLAQGFTSVVMLAQAARADLSRDQSAPAVERLELIERTARENLAEARALVAAFAPAGLAESGLPATLTRLAQRFTQETGVEVDVEVEESCGAIGREREVVLLRSAQEALTNVGRHAQAHRVLLALTREPGGQVRLEVADDGRGIDASRAEGFGLRGMRERVTSGGGRLVVSDRPSGGTQVQVTLPAEGGPAEPAEPSVPCREAREEGR